MKKIFFLVCYFSLHFLMGQTSVPEPEWEIFPGGPLTDSGQDITTDQWGNVYVTGHFRDTADFDTGPGLLPLATLGGCVGGADIFIAKYNAIGEVVWAISMGGKGDDRGNRITIDSIGNVYVIGRFEGLVDFNPGLGVDYLSTNLLDENNISIDDLFILKLTSDGDFMWARHIEGINPGGNLDIAVDDENNVYATGSFSGAIDFDPGSGEYIIYSNGNTEAFILKLNTHGEFVWAKNIDSSSYYSRGNAIAIDENNNVITIGMFGGENVDFDPGLAEFNMTAIGYSDLFILNLDSNGDFVWAKNIGGASSSLVSSSIAIGNQGRIHLTGNYDGLIDFDTGSSVYELTGDDDIFILQLDNLGEFVWVQSIGGDDYDRGRDIIIDEEKNIYLTGHFGGTVDFDPGSEIFNLIGAAIFVLKLDVNGTFIWADEIDNTYNSWYDTPIALDPWNNLYISGSASLPGYNTNVIVKKWRQTACTAHPTINSDNNTFAICSGNPISLNAEMPDWTTNVTYLWNTGATSESISVAPDSSSTFTVAINYTADSVACQTSTAVLVPVFQNLVEVPYNGFDDDCNSSTLDDDLDQDGYVLALDCDDNDPNIPGDPGTYCDDGNPNTFNDVIQADGCTCSGAAKNAPVFDWVKRLSGDDHCNGRSVATDRWGNLYTTGRFAPPMNFDPGSTDYILEGPGTTFISKNNTNGQLEWAVSISGTVGAIHTDTLGFVYLTGTFEGTKDFDPGSGTFYLYGYEEEEDIYVLKLDENGAFIWAKSIGEGRSDYGKEITTDNNGNVYVSGEFESTVDFDPGSTTYPLTPNGERDIFILKLNSEGDFLWANSIGGPEDDYVGAIALDSLGNVYSSGSYEGAVDFDSGNGQFILTSEGNTPFLYFLKLNSEGGFTWAKSINTYQGFYYGNNCTVDKAGNLYAIGRATVDIDLDPGLDSLPIPDSNLGDMFILKLDENGDFNWVKFTSVGFHNNQTAIALDRNDNIYVTGTFSDVADFDPGPESFYLSPCYGSDAFILKLDTVGAFIWAGAFDKYTTSSFGCFPYSISIDDQDNICTIGSVNNQIDFDPGLNTYRLDQINNKGDIFIHKLRQNPCYSSPKIISTIPFGICPGDSITLGVELPTWASNATYTWSTGENSDSITVAPSVDSMYTVAVSYSADGSFCNGTDSVLVAIQGMTAEIPYNGLDDDCDETTLDDDLDQDGFNLAEDCDDNNPLVNNGAVEIPYNGLDDDCDETTPDDDLDGDGYLMADDCDDSDSFFPNTPGINCDDGILTTFNDVIQPDSCTCAGTSFVDPPVFEWANQIGGNEDTWGNSDFGQSITTDRWGNVFTTGAFQGTVDFDPGLGNNTLVASGIRDIFVTKFDPNGKLIWAFSFGTTGTNTGNGIATDTLGNVFITGDFSGTVDFDPGTESQTLTSSGETDIFVLKLDNNGQFIWAKKMSGEDAGAGTAIVLDDSGNVYTTGHFTGTFDFDPGSGSLTHTAPGYWTNIFISKLNTDGELVWAKSIGAGGFDLGYSIALDNNNNVYLTGSFDDTVDFNPGPGVYNLTAVSFFQSLFVLKLTEAGNFVWARSTGASGSRVEGYGIVVDGTGKVYITGEFGGTVDFNLGAGTYNVYGFGHIFILKLSSNGNFEWVKTIGASVASTSTDEAKGRAIDVDENNNVYVTGNYFGTTDFDPGPGVYNLSPSSYDDIFVLKLDASGSFIWAGSFAGPGLYEWGSSIHIDNWDNIYTTGRFIETNDFDPGLDVYELSSNGFKDIFIHKMRQQPCGTLPGLCSSGSQFANCTEDSIVLNVALPSLATGLSYTWNTGETTDSIIVSPDTTTTYSLDVTYEFESALCSHSIALEIIVGGGNIEVPYNGLDDDCDETTPDDDLDQDGFGISEDCDDNDATAYPGATEIPNNDVDEDCDGNILIIDEDMDGYNSDEDCDDGNPLVNPGQVEIPFNGIDDDCDENTLDENNDQDGDGFPNDIDCDDYDPLINPDATEIPYNGIDDDCNELTPDNDLDQDGFLLLEDCNDMDASVPAAPGTPCNDYSNNTFNDVLLADSCSCAGTTLTNDSPIMDWVFTEGGSVSGKDIVTDDLGNVYVTGRFEGTIDFDPGPGVTNLSSLWWHADIFVAKYTPDGQLLWARRYGDDYTDIGYGITLDGNGNVYMIGRYSDATGNVASTYNIYIKKLNADNGGTIWTKKMGDDWCHGYDITVDEEGNVYSTGIFTGTVDFNPGGGVYNLSSWADNSSNIFISKLDSQGNFVWAKNIGEGGTNIGNSIQVYNEHLYLTGTFRSDSDFDPGPGEYDMDRIGEYDLFALKLNTAGEFIWAKQIGGFGAEIRGNDLVVDSNEDLYITGSFEGEVDFPFGNDTLSLASESSHFVLKLNPDGESIWLRPILDGASVGNGISLDEEDNVYTIGNYIDTIDFDPGAGTYYLPGDESEYFSNVFIQKLSPDGEFQWASSFRGSFISSGNALSVDSWGSVLSTGSFYDTVDFDPTPELYEVTAGGSNFFIHKLIPEPCLPNPTIGSINDDFYFCQGTGDSLIFYAEVDTLNSPIYFEWSTGVTSDSILVVTDTTTTYTLLSYSSNGCVGIDSVLVVVNINDVEIPYNGLDDDCDEATLDDDLDQDGFGIAEDCDDNNPEINTDALEIPNNGIDEDCDGEDLLVSAKEILTIKPQVFPNPTSGLLQVVFPETVQGSYEIRNLTGKLILKKAFVKEATLDLSYLPQGVYILLMKMENGIWTERVVKI